MPNLDVYRPADAVETAECWELALRAGRRPVAARADPPEPAAAAHSSGARISARAAPIALRAAAAPRKVVLIATGSEVEVALGVADALEGQGIGADVVSMPCWELFDAQDAAYRADILPGDALLVSIEAGATFGWERYTGRDGLAIGLDRLRRLGARPRICSSTSASPPRRSCRRSSRRSNSRRSMTWRPELRSTVSGGSAAWSRARSSRTARQRPRAGRDQRPRRRQVQRPAVQARSRPRRLSGRGPGRRQRPDHRRQAHQGHRRARSRPSCRTATTASTSRWNAPASSPTATAASKHLDCRREESPDLGPGQGRRPDRRLRRQSRQARPPSTRSSPTPRAPPTAWRRSPRC